MEQLYQELYAARAGIALSWATLFLFAAVPGPTAMAIMGISMCQGRKASFTFTTGCMLSSTMWGILAAFGLSTWLNHLAGGVMVLKILGGSYLLWMAFKATKSAFAANATLASHAVSSSKSVFFYGVAMHATNPKAIFGWAAALTLSQTENSSLGVLVFTLIGCLLITYGVHYGYAFAFTSDVAMRGYAKARRSIQGTLAVVFGYAGYRLITD